MCVWEQVRDLSYQMSEAEIPTRRGERAGVQRGR